MKWWKRVVGVREHAPLLLADADTWRRWNGTAEPQSSYDVLDGEVGVVDVGGRKVVPSEYEGGIFDVGVGRNEIVVLQHYDDDEHDELDDLRKEIGARALDEYAAGELEIGSGVVIGDPWEAGDAIPATLPDTQQKVGDRGYFLPLRAGTYVVLEGRTEGATWYRLRKGKLRDYPKRDTALSQADGAARDVAYILDHLKLDNDRDQARALESARKLVTLGRPDAALDICERVGASRAKLAEWTRLFALAALGRDAATPARSLAEEWLAPATAADSANQIVTREDMLAALDAVIAAGSDLAAIRARVASAPAPEVFVGGSDDFF